MKSILKVVLFALASIFFLQSNAADIYWLGSGGDWNDISKWSYDNFTPCACIPAATDNAIIATDFINVTANATVNSIDVFGTNPPGGNIITIQSGVILTINGIGTFNAFKVSSNYDFVNMGSLVINNSDTFGLHVYGTAVNNGEIVSSFCDNAIRVKGSLENNGLIQLSESSYGIVCDASSVVTNNGTITVTSSDLNYWFFPRGIRVSSSYFENNGNIIISDTKLGIECLTPFGGTNLNPGFYNRSNASISLINIENVGLTINTNSNYDFVNEVDANIDINGIYGFNAIAFDVISTGFDCLGNLTVSP